MGKTKKPAVEECTARLQAVTAALVTEGATLDMIVAAHVIVAIKAGRKHRLPDRLFDTCAKSFENATYDAFEQGKKDRAAKRRKKLGLPEPRVQQE